MDNMEMIEIRLAQNINHKLETDIKQIIREVSTEESGFRIKLYTKANLTNDYLIIILIQNKNITSAGIGLGQRIKAAFREHGLVNHTKWNEIISIL